MIDLLTLQKEDIFIKTKFSRKLEGITIIPIWKVIEKGNPELYHKMLKPNPKKMIMIGYIAIYVSKENKIVSVIEVFSCVETAIHQSEVLRTRFLEKISSETRLSWREEREIAYYSMNFIEELLEEKVLSNKDASSSTPEDNPHEFITERDYRDESLYSICASTHLNLHEKEQREEDLKETL